MSVQAVIFYGKFIDRLLCEALWKNSYPNAQFYSIENITPPDEKLDEATELIFLDFIFPNEIMKQLATNSKGEARTIRLITCNENFTEELKGVKCTTTTTLYINKTSLLASWEYLHPNDEVPYWISDMDSTFRQKSDTTTESYMFFPYFRYIANRIEDPLCRYEYLIVDKETAIRRTRLIDHKRDMVQQYLSQSIRKCLVGDKLVGVVFENSNIEGYYLLSQQILRLNPELSAIASASNMYNSVDSWRLLYTLRSDSGYSTELPGLEPSKSQDRKIWNVQLSSNPFLMLTEVENNLKLPEFDSAEFDKLLSGEDIHDDDQIFFNNCVKINAKYRPRKYLYEGKVVGVFHQSLEPFGKESAEYALDIDSDLTAVAVVNYSITEHKWNLTFYSREGESEFSNCTVDNFDAFELFDEE